MGATMNGPLSVAVQDPVSGAALVPPHEPPVPSYLEQVYWWAYVHPNAVHVFERDWLVNAILFGIGRPPATLA